MHLMVLADSSSSSGDSSEYGLLILPIVFAIAFWTFTYRRYRNQDARNVFEQTPSRVSDLRAVDERVNHRTGLRSKTIDGRNDDDATAPIPIDKMWPDPPTHGMTPGAAGFAQAGGPAPGAASPDPSPAQPPTPDWRGTPAPWPTAGTPQMPPGFAGPMAPQMPPGFAGPMTSAVAPGAAYPQAEAAGPTAPAAGPSSPEAPGSPSPPAKS